MLHIKQLNISHQRTRYGERNKKGLTPHILNRFSVLKIRSTNVDTHNISLTHKKKSDENGSKERWKKTFGRKQ
ncbi:CLUMA_CG002955, isoform A [Clunio marinus]|uniref:CLUMA_CG002955, isoform A n=1 Tax=Clunio marinus TaxID=568069 RepID=A0A1J1HMN0_9DIPT|nr:CLUMA_CG002955, isoform A [Clunio marinus]